MRMLDSNEYHKQVRRRHRPHQPGHRKELSHPNKSWPSSLPLPYFPRRPTNELGAFHE
jgi:hypothetical protein